MTVGPMKGLPILVKAISDVSIRGEKLNDEIKDAFREVHATGLNVSSLIE